MNRVALCIKMLDILNMYDKITSQELAKILETNPRNIREFRKELEMAGYTIDEQRGRHGGLMLRKDKRVISSGLSHEEIEAIKEASMLVASLPSFANQQTYQSAVAKIISLSSNEDIKERQTFIHQGSIQVSQKQKKFIEKIQRAIDHQQCVEIEYQSTKDTKPKRRRIDPYEIVYYHQSYYCMGYSHERKDMRTYRFSDQRLFDVEILYRKFLRDESFRIENYIGKHSLIRQSFEKVDLWVSKKSIRLFEEQYWGLSYQKWEEIDGYHVTFFNERRMELFQKLLPMIQEVKILAPEELRSEMISLFMSALQRQKKEVQ